MIKDIKSKLQKKFQKAAKTTSPLEPTMAPLPATRDEILMTLFKGVYDPESPLSTLRGIPHLLRLIFQLATNEFWWRKCIKLPDRDLDAKLVEMYHNRQLRYSRKLNNEDTLLFFTELHPTR